MNNDLISREALLKAMEEERQYLLARGQTGAEHILVHHCLPLIDNAPTVDIKDEIAGAYNEGYMCGNKEAEKARPQGKYVDISKLRLMTVKECAGHTIGYAMGWKACIEWIKKGGAE